MDPLSDFLDGPRARNAFLLRVVMSSPWAIDVSDGAPLTLVAVLSGHSWVVPESAPAVQLRRGDVFVVGGDAPYLLASELGLPPTVHIGTGQACSGPDGRDLSTELSTGVRTWGNDVDGEDQLLVGTFRSAGEVGRILLGALPPTFVVRADDNPMVAALAEEVARDGIAQGTILDRLLDLVLIQAVRSWSEIAREARPDWLSGNRDPVVKEALMLLHENPGRSWTTESLAGSVAVSRASLARRFHAIVGQPPMAYLTQWRLALAADLLLDPQLTLSAISERVGYGSPFSFSTAFKKHYGVSPQGYRTG
ncbi:MULTISPECIES: AraC family transcriptional regulator [unclassified Rathayibacter]|uniref:AraC family transcriptional regulator n=1 Tax=unclassified Rathayibacter TaxID=2609250 RepID=UPI00188C0546|nr:MULTISPECIES: AraC family transcriptional regulator [unclassified Rathayibacter]MBF4463168.1 AraC family transcriptional regulator [Rathayibacter sp. VKM Ac-2879]MBF4504595.1 AraC family transcriptional regulator [Rathayibacter sp. VKM Ac-2878]